MGSVLIETYVARPPDEVFAFLRDYSNEAKWQAKHVSQAIVEPPGPAQVGTRVHKVRRMGGSEQRFTVEITEMDEAARRWTDMMTTGPFRGTTGQWQVLPEGSGSRVRAVATMRTTGVLRMLLPIMSASMRRDLQSEFANLKQLLELAPRP
jgi:carbon monoxide dehydrogenase subunit G